MNFTGLKAQSAIEYLMTYGWMLLVVAIVGGAIFSLAGPQCMEVEDFSNTGTFIDDFAVDRSSGNMTLVMGNAESETVQINSIEIEAGENSTAETIEDFEISPADTEPVTLSQQFTTTEECNSYDVNLEYDRGSLTGLESSGSITADIEVASAPDTPQIEDINQ